VEFTPALEFTFSSQLFFRIALGSVKFCPPYLQTHLEMKTSGEGGILKRYLL